MNNERMCNVLYITTHCNLDCEYCYEKTTRDKPGFKHKTITKQEIDDFVQEILEREGPELDKIVSIFGGEALLRFDLVKYAIEQICEYLPKTGIDIITNGTFFIDIENLQRMKDLQEYASKHQVHIGLRISYDGSGNFRRVYAKTNTPVTSDILQVFEHFRTLKMPLNIAYTVHKGNCDKKSFIKDISSIILKYRDILDRISTYFYEEEIEAFYGFTHDEFLEYKNWIKERCAYLFQKFKIPLCYLTCEACSLCDKVQTKRNYFVPDDGNKFVELRHEEKFDHWNDKFKGTK